MKNYLFLVLGLIMVGLGLYALITDPPRTYTCSQSELIPYTAFREIPPGWHNKTVYYTVGKGNVHIDLPGHNTTRISIGSLNTKNCTIVAPVLNIYGEGYFRAEDNKHINITLMVEQGSKTNLLDKIDVVIKASSLAVTSTPITVTMKPGETPPEPPQLNTSYMVKSSKGLLQATVYKPDDKTIAVTIDTATHDIQIPLNITALILEINGDASGRLHLDVYAKDKCIITYYIDKPLYIPYTSYKTITIKYNCLNLGSLIVSAILTCIGIVSILLSCYLALYSNKNKGNKKPSINI